MCVVYFTMIYYNDNVSLYVKKFYCRHLSAITSLLNPYILIYNRQIYIPISINIYFPQKLVSSIHFISIHLQWVWTVCEPCRSFYLSAQIGHKMWSDQHVNKSQRQNKLNMQNINKTLYKIK